jgi:hypothetical protein
VTAPVWPMLVAAARRFAAILAGVVAATAAVSLALGLLLGAPVDRSLAVGCYLAGCTFLLGGFFFGNRGPFRVANEEGLVGIRRPRGIRPVSALEQEESFNLSGVLVLVGLILLVLGAAVDPRTQLI